MPSFRFTVPGQPISLNHAYRPVRYKTANGYQRRMAKVEGVEEYQLVAKAAANHAKPSDFAPKGLVYVRYWWHVRRDIDCSNATKIIEDGIAAGLGLDDKLFLPASVFKQVGVKEPFTTVEVEYNQ